MYASLGYYRLMNYGVDIGATRLDDVDKKVLTRVRELIAEGIVPRVLDVGAGAGGLAIALAAAGAEVTILDITDYRDEIETRCVQNGIDFGVIEVVVADMTAWVATNTHHYDVVVLQRVLHYVPYAAAWTILEQLRLVTDELYLSVTGTTTAIAAHYDSLPLPIEERWGELAEEGKDLFSITAPLCLYSENEILELLATTGWHVTWSRVSDFGNVKVVAKKI
jgi:SAM-dependent methyltransferase